MDEWTDMGNGTFRRDYTNYIYGVIAPQGSAFEAGLYNCAGFECKTLSKQTCSSMQLAEQFLDAEARKF